MAVDATCDICGEDVETICHKLRDSALGNTLHFDQRYAGLQKLPKPLYVRTIIYSATQEQIGTLN
ncbi:hypothetical protein Syun_026042 [Stephania yunnanensis]|uniref:Uncharacterized protein n=1 Tax=Stephania yunnanensis TaxID=152371 RepID=A0AAP0HVC9_9MAGN